MRHFEADFVHQSYLALDIEVAMIHHHGQITW
jgi:hypothetical protein